MKNLNSVIVVGAGTAGLISALMLHEKYPHLNIQIIKSDKIGIVGVGEGSTEHWRTFMEFCGINQRELIYKTKATVKLGIVFKDWNLGETYAHSLTEIEAKLSGLNRLENLNLLYLSGKKLSFLDLEVNDFRFLGENVSNQFHFDTFKLNEFLVDQCIKNGIKILVGEVQGINLDHSGSVQSIFTTSGNLVADFFIDCSGFHRIFSKSMDNAWISKAEYLPMNRAIAFPTTMQENALIEPYTLSTALSAGWSWRIPTQERYGNGYVFDNRYITADQALEEISTSLNLSDVQPGRDIPFEAGKINKIWNKNVLHVGLSGSFAEPLEAQSIGYTIVQMFAFLHYSDLYNYNLEYQIQRYNNEMD
ncbi:FAD-dependent oxidoreductase, partial [archaeon]|nr:FAD-dependent oxidoreductase [archaeon]